MLINELVSYCIISPFEQVIKQGEIRDVLAAPILAPSMKRGPLTS